MTANEGCVFFSLGKRINYTETYFDYYKHDILKSNWYACE